MARTLARLPPGARITDYISLGVVAQWFPRSTVERVLADSGKSSRRRRDLPAHVVVYYVIALALYGQVSYGEVLRCLLEGLEWLGLNVRRQISLPLARSPRFLQNPVDGRPRKLLSKHAQTHEIRNPGSLR